MTTVLKINGVEIQEKPNGYRCECGASIKKRQSLESHTETKSHADNMRRRQLHGNTVVFVSLLKPDIKVYR